MLANSCTVFYVWTGVVLLLCLVVKLTKALGLYQLYAHCKRGEYIQDPFPDRVMH